MYCIPHIRRWAFGIGLLALASGAAWAQTQINACDVASQGTVNQTDVNAIIAMTLGETPCTANIAGQGVCNAAVVQRVINASLGGACVTGYGAVAHYVSLSWTASTTPSVTYNVYRSTTSGSYSTPLASAGANTSYIDSAVAAGQTYYYVVTAVSGSTESAYSNPAAQAAIPTP